MLGDFRSHLPAELDQPLIFGGPAAELGNTVQSNGQKASERQITRQIRLGVDSDLELQLDKLTPARTRQVDRDRLTNESLGRTSPKNPSEATLFDLRDGPRGITIAGIKTLKLILTKFIQ